MGLIAAGISLLLWNAYEAMNGVERLAEAVPVVLGTTGPAGQTYPPATSGPRVALVWILALIFLAGGLFVLINAGDLNEVKKLLAGFYRRDLAGTLEPLTRKIPIKQWINAVIDRIKKHLSTGS